jgi:outer membrane protein assembly factor BamC
MSVDKDLPSKGQIDWPARSINGERESWMLDELAATIASDSGSSQAASLLAQTIGLSDKVKLDAEGEEPVLRLVLEYNRAWATVGHAVRQGAFSTWGSDEVVGVYYIDYDPEYTDETEEPGFFSRWFGSADEDQPESSSPYSLSEVLAHLQLEDTESNRKIFKSIKSGSADPLDEVPGYLVVVRGWNDSIEVRVRDGYARNLPNQEAKKLLNMIRHNLI